MSASSLRAETSGSLAASSASAAARIESQARTQLGLVARRPGADLPRPAGAAERVTRAAATAASACCSASSSLVFAGDARAGGLAAGRARPRARADGGAASTEETTRSRPGAGRSSTARASRSRSASRRRRSTPIRARCGARARSRSPRPRRSASTPRSSTRCSPTARATSSTSSGRPIRRRRAALEQLSLPGLGFYPEELRYYPQRGVAAHVLGYAGIDNNGLEGLERSLERRSSASPAARRGHAIRAAE